jgi:ATP-binding cassette subfamily F protein uup
VFLVSHDRRFLDNVVTSTIVAEGEGRWREYEGGVEDWLLQSERARQAQAEAARRAVPAAAPAAPAAAAGAPPAAARRTKLSYKEQRELDALPARIEALEAEQRSLSEELADGRLYARDAARAGALQRRHAEIEDELMAALERWEALGAR